MYIVKYPEKGRISTEGVVVLWEKKVGEPIKKGELLLKIESSGEWLELESAAEGTLLKVATEVGRFVKSGQPLAVIGTAGENLAKALDKLSEKTPSAVAAQTTQATPQKKEEIMTSQKPSGNPDNVIPVLMPQAGQSMEEGTILSWKVKEGQQIAVGQIIMEIETDKATMEVEATDAGRLARIIAKEGEVVPVKKPVALIAENDADVDAWLAGAGIAAPAAKSMVSSAASVPAAAKFSASVPEGAVIPVLMPQAGQSMEEGTILSWKVKEGDRITVGQIIMEIETDKATMEVEAVDAGQIAKIVSAEGAIVPVKTPVAYLAEENIDINAYLGSMSVPTTAPTSVKVVKPVTAPSGRDARAPRATAVSESGRVKASPAARKAAKDKGIDLASIGAGSGPGGRILSSDVEGADITPTEIKIHPLTKMRKAIANNLLYSKQNIPHFYAKTTIDAGALFNTYRKTKEQFKCTVNDFVTMACAKVIRQYPVFRSQYKGNEVVEKPSVNIGIAVGTDEGLTVPVVVDADRMNLEQLSARTRQVVESARNGKLEGLGQGIFTITNLGMFGVEEFSAIINPPESAILAVGAIREGVAVENGQMRPTRLMTVTLSVDHRVIDGVMAAQFLKTLKEVLEKPEALV